MAKKKTPLVYVISISMLAATAGRGLLQAFEINNPYRWLIAGLMAVYGLLLFTDLAIIRRFPLYAKIYFVIQAGIVVGLISLPLWPLDEPRSNDFFALLFMPLCVQAILFFRRPAGYYWVIALTAVNSIALHYQYGLNEGIKFSVTYILAFTMVCFLAIFYINAEEAKDELNKAHEKLQEYAKNAEALAVAEERNRLARDLHDSVTQSLYSLTLFAEAANEELSAGQVETASEHLKELKETSQQALQEMRLMVFELRPPELETKGLALALQERFEAVEARAGIETILNLEYKDRLPPTIETGLYNIAREAMNNILKHSQATQVTINLKKVGGNVVLEIGDNGVGLAGTLDGANSGLGIKGMEERAKQIGAILKFDTRLDSGALVRVEVNDG